MVPCCNNDGLARLLTHHADSLGHLRHAAGVLGEAAAEIFGVEVGRRGLRATGQNDHNQCEPKTSHRATDTAQVFQIWIARHGEVALNCLQTRAEHMKDDVNQRGMDDVALRAIAAEAAAAFETGGPQVQPFSARFPDLTMDDAYRITALANGIRVAKGYRPVGRKIGFTNRRIWDEYGVHAPVWGYVYDRTVYGL